MIGRALRIGTLVLVALGLVTACGSSNRPHELSMDEVKPCDLISRSERQQLRVPDKGYSRDSVSGVNLEGRTCFYRVLPGNTVKISAITNHGIGRWTDGPFEDTESKDVPPIRDFRTIRAWGSHDRPTPMNTCRLYIDVADGQSLRVQVGEKFDKDGPPTCDTARKFAEAAMETLISKS